MKNIPVRQIKTSASQQAELGRFSIRKVTDVLNGRDLVHDLHRHDFFFILALEKGNGRHEIDFINHPVSDNSIFILRPGQVHQLELSAEGTGYILEFDTVFYQSQENATNQRLKKATSKNYCDLEVSRFNKLLGILQSVFNEYTLKEEGYIDAIRSNLDIFFIEFIRQSNNPQQIGRNGGLYTQERFEEFMRLLESRIKDLKSVSEYAELLNVSPYQLNAITKTAVGKTASELITEQILLEAKRYLLATPNQVKEVADHLGYEDVSYFIRFFKRHTGHSPEAFRKNFK